MAAWAKPGVRCVCIDDDWSDYHCKLLGIEPPSRVPMLNEVLTIRAVYPSTIRPYCLALQFSELGHEFGFPAHCFRPLTTRTLEQDMSHFTPLLTSKERELS